MKYTTSQIHIALKISKRFQSFQHYSAARSDVMFQQAGSDEGEKAPISNILGKGSLLTKSIL